MTVRLTQKQRVAYEAWRGADRSRAKAACHAPFVTMSFHPSGRVIACCRKPGIVIGDIRHQRLDSIWHGAIRRELRESLLRYEFPTGCDVCAAYVAHGDFATSDCGRTYAIEALHEVNPRWPTRLEFNMANTCSLQCVMCNGTLSSSIRKHREGLPPLPRVYDDRFFEDVRSYLHHIGTAIFLGGEPFQQVECFRIWDMMIEDGISPRSYVNTNGMVFNEKVERVLSTLPMNIAVSMDGCTAATVESIRIGSSFARMLENVKRFKALTTARGGRVILNFCLMRQNHHELADFLLMAEDLGADTYLNTMVAPSEMSLYHLPNRELAAIVGQMRDRADELIARIPRNAPRWQEAVKMLEGKISPATQRGLRHAENETERTWRALTRSQSEGATRAEGLADRARRVLAQTGPYGSPHVITVKHGKGAYPLFATRADGARFWDAADNEYLDWFLSSGAVALGHRHPAVQKAVAEQLELGANVSLVPSLEVEVAERICSLFPSIELVAFGKNGSDVTEAAVRFARAETGRDLVLTCGYHGFHDWSQAGRNCAGIPAALSRLVRTFTFNDLESVERALHENEGQVAAIVVEPMQSRRPAPGFLAGLRELADRKGAVLVFDEVVTGLRVARGGIQARENVRPDLTCLAKALGNGLSISALGGARRLMRHTTPAHFHMTYRRDALALAAARATLDVHSAEDVAGHLHRIGGALMDGLRQAIELADLEWSIDGHPAMPYLHFTGGGRLTEIGATRVFVQACQRESVFVQGSRLFPSYSHTEADVERTLDAAAAAMNRVRAAMEEGIAQHYDGPITPGLERERSVPNAGAKMRSKALPSAGGAPSTNGRTSTRSGAQVAWRRHVVARTWPETSPATARWFGDHMRLTVRRSARGEVHVCGIGLSCAIAAAHEVAVQYRITEPGSDSAFVRLSLLTITADGAQARVAHDLAPSRTQWSRADLGGEASEVLCRYGALGGTLILQHRGGITSAYHYVDEQVEVGSSRMPTGPVEVQIQLSVQGASERITVDLIDIEITELS